MFYLRLRSNITKWTIAVGVFCSGFMGVSVAALPEFNASYVRLQQSLWDAQLQKSLEERRSFTRVRELPQMAARGGYSAYRYASGFPHYMPATGKQVFVFDPRRLRFALYAPDGSRIESGKAVGGSHYCRDVKRGCRTPTGIFRIYAKKGADCISQRYPLPSGGAPMPYCHYFKGGYAIHGAYHMPNINASHGCIRIHPATAKRLYSQYHMIGTVVVVRRY